MPTSDLDLPLLPSAEQIRRREFATLRRGYDPDQVRDYLEAVAVQVEILEKDLKDARLPAGGEGGRSPAVAHAGRTHRPTRTTASRKRFAGLLATADREASRIVDEAKTEADRVVIEAKTQADRIRTDAQSRAEQDRQEGPRRMESARDEADRILAGLAARRESARRSTPGDAVAAAARWPRTSRSSIESSPARGEDVGTMAGDADEVDASIEHMTEAIEISEGAGRHRIGGRRCARRPSIRGPLGLRGRERSHRREVDLDQLFTDGEEVDDASVDIPDLASIELDFDEDRPDTAT